MCKILIKCESGVLGQGAARQRAVVGRNRIEIVAGFVPDAGVVLVWRDVAVVAVGEENVLVDHQCQFGRGRGRLALGGEIDVGRSVAVDVVLALGGDVEAQQRLFEGLALLPAHDVVVAESLHRQLDGAFAADFEDHPLVRTRDVGIAGLRIRQVGVGVFVGVVEDQVGHAHTVAQPFDREVDVLLREGSQLGLGLGEIEVDLRRAEDRQVVERLVVGVLRRSGDELHDVVAGDRVRQVRR